MENMTKLSMHEIQLKVKIKNKKLFPMERILIDNTFDPKRIQRRLRTTQNS
jgi:hypothetical protein